MRPSRFGLLKSCFRFAVEGGNLTEARRLVREMRMTANGQRKPDEARPAPGYSPAMPVMDIWRLDDDRIDPSRGPSRSLPKWHPAFENSGNQGDLDE